MFPVSTFISLTNKFIVTINYCNKPEKPFYYFYFLFCFSKDKFIMLSELFT